ncbi:hypothetical protein Q3G72_009226 [Acer saccharum]|nr:hypothetical protein Q3G72_009226 [Acer saccharum]
MEVQILLKKQKKIQVLRWLKPALGRLKLNLDGSSLGNPGPAGGGGLLCNSSGHNGIDIECDYDSVVSWIQSRVKSKRIRSAAYLYRVGETEPSKASTIFWSETIDNRCLLEVHI